MPMPDFDVIVIGAGVIGLSCGYQLARRNFKTLILEQFTIGNKLSSSHGSTRIIRKTQSEEVFIQMAFDAYSEWDELSRITGTELYLKNGLLTIDEAPATTFREALARKYEINHEVIQGGANICRRFPYLQNLDEQQWAIYEPHGGSVLVENCLKALYSQFLSHGRKIGCELRENEAVSDFSSSASFISPAAEVRVHTTRRSYTATRLVIAAGVWLSRLVPDLPLKTTPLVVSSNFWLIRSRPELFNPRSTGHDDALSPSLIAVERGEDDFYMIPCIDYPNMIKFSIHFGVPFDPSTELADRRIPEYLVKKCSDYITKHMPDVEGSTPAIHTTCAYTMTDDELFVVDYHPSNKNVVIAGGFSGTGFKIGKIVVALVEGRVDELRGQFDLHKLSLSRNPLGYKAKL